MKLAKIGARGRTTIPKTVRDAADLREGDVIAFEIEGDCLVVHKVASGGEYLRGLSGVMGEWLSPEDERAWSDL
ncbi:MAG: AbrB/MazE/SpoVT family DNA-binding domain-containing protein [Rhodospirillales bacterium]|nr:AbrB/MazE/SpoVT family DNA-binding domain-containing protein [Rhodospirillales bacterium]